MLSRIDIEIRQLVSLWNRFPGITTLASCAGHKEGEGGYIAFTADTQSALEAVVRAAPFTGYRAGFERNEPTSQWVWFDIPPSENGLTYRCQFVGVPFRRQRDLIQQIEESLEQSLSRLGVLDRRPPCSRYASVGNADNSQSSC